jgi:glycine oxidase
VRGLVWATGHYRNGILLAPLTAELVVGVLAGDGRAATRTGDDAHASLLAACAPARFAASLREAERGVEDEIEGAVA